MSLAILPAVYGLELGPNLKVIICQVDLIVRDGHAAALLGRRHLPSETLSLAARGFISELRLHRQYSSRHSLFTIARAAAAIQLALFGRVHARLARGGAIAA